MLRKMCCIPHLTNIDSQFPVPFWRAEVQKSSPEGIRTLVAGLRSQSPRPLDDGAMIYKRMAPKEKYS